MNEFVFFKIYIYYNNVNPKRKCSSLLLPRITYRFTKKKKGRKEKMIFSNYNRKLTNNLLLIMQPHYSVYSSSTLYMLNAFNFFSL
jgi:hypothetical protein